jgi:hypothetical protein
MKSGASISFGVNTGVALRLAVPTGAATDVSFGDARRDLVSA